MERFVHDKRWFLLLIGMFAVPALHAQPTIQIEADRVEYNAKTHRMQYIGNVLARRGNMSITGNTIEAQMQDGEIKRMEVQGSPMQFHLRKKSGKETILIAERAVFFANEDKIRLSGNVRITHKGAIVEGDQIDYYIAEDRIVSKNPAVDQRVKVILPQ